MLRDHYLLWSAYASLLWTFQPVRKVSRPLLKTFPNNWAFSPTLSPLNYHNHVNNDYGTCLFISLNSTHHNLTRNLSILSIRFGSSSKTQLYSVFFYNIQGSEKQVSVNSLISTWSASELDKMPLDLNSPASSWSHSLSSTSTLDTCGTNDS